jgi:AcrR family transcriptional regulator
MTRLSRDDIIAGAGRRFATHGYHGTSMRDLGSSIYAHVGGKQELLVAVIEHGAEYFEASATAALALGNARDQLEAFIKGHIDVVLDHRAEARTYLSEVDFLDDDQRKAVADRRDGYERHLVGILERCVAEGVIDQRVDVRLSSIYVLSILNTIDRWFSETGRVGRDALGDDVFRFVLSGLGGTS